MAGFIQKLYNYLLALQYRKKLWKTLGHLPQMIKENNTTGLSSYKNWKSALAGEPLQNTYEFPLYTDAYIIGQIDDALGPYKLINSLALADNSLLPRLTLRAEFHLKYDYKITQDIKTDFTSYHGGELKDEIAALLSLFFGFRLKAGDATRYFDPIGDPKGQPLPGYFESPTLLKSSKRKPILPGVLGKKCLDKYRVLTKFSNLNPDDAVALVRSARLYQDALWISESEPSLSWIMLVSAIEIVANHYIKSNESSIERLKIFKPELEHLLKKAGGDKLVVQVADLIVDYMGSTKKFIGFILEFLPNPPTDRPAEAMQHKWDSTSLKKSLSIIYRWRSKALHSGIPFPEPMCDPPLKLAANKGFDEIPPGLATESKGATWLRKDTPMLLHLFEYIVRNTLLKWWESVIPKKEGEK